LTYRVSEKWEKRKHSFLSVVDTSVWIDYVRGVEARHTDLLDRVLIPNRVITGDLIIMEKHLELMVLH
jgi:hypothetical protein